MAEMDKKRIRGSEESGRLQVVETSFQSNRATGAPPARSTPSTGEAGTTLVPPRGSGSKRSSDVLSILSGD